MRMKRTLYPVLMLLILLLAACAPQASQPPTGATPPAGTTLPGLSTTPDADAFENTHWSLVFFGPPEAKKPVVAGSNVTLLAAGGKFGGFAGCNSYGGVYEINGDQLSLHDINSTLVACVDGQIMQQEQRYFEALQSAGTFEVKDNQLTITYDSNKGVLVFEKALTTNG
jgi:heat shock protein HslJ